MFAVKADNILGSHAALYMSDSEEIDFTEKRAYFKVTHVWPIEIDLTEAYYPVAKTEMAATLCLQTAKLIRRYNYSYLPLHDGLALGYFFF